MSFLKDTFAILKKSDLAFLKRYKESDGVYTFLFEKEKDLTWHAGQHGLFTITHRKIKNATRPLTVASTPAENVVKITTAISDKPSEFKKALLELEEGMKIRMNGPVGSFYLNDNSPALFIAGGIGITPFRAIVKQLEAEGNGVQKQIKLLYLDSGKSYIYKDELDRNTSIDTSYLASRDELYLEMDKFITSNNNNAKYFIAGSKSMVDSITSHLKSKGILKRNIKKDAFMGIN
ncbi:ferredoxin-NADP reductase [Bacillus tianshenii]|uniref:Ferredoxin-NADP reductase n=1 Tax=Sutcliffiella tianshenii TaxID=1463404 RepID=A0ABS2NVH9_9BACI|nr:FAD-dependent oxidoreductase [Bacillus tianshenii]MBM7618497.1 ferredoxin-NADP reductase [Bacillus tianshenii]